MARDWDTAASLTLQHPVFRLPLPLVHESAPSVKMYSGPIRIEGSVVRTREN